MRYSKSILIFNIIKIVVSLSISLAIASCANNSGYGYGVSGGSNMSGAEASFGMTF